MRKLISVASLALLSATMTASADGGQVVTINGTKVDKTVGKMTFEGDNLVLTYSDNTTQTVDMASVTIAFSVADAVKALEKESADAPVNYFDLNGRQLKQAPQKGAYMVKKGNTVVKILTR